MTWMPPFARESKPNLWRAVGLFIVALWLSGCGNPNGGSADLCQATEQGISTSLADNTAVFQAALNACAGQTMHVAAGVYKFAPAIAYADDGGFGRGIKVPERTAIVGDGAGKTILQIVGPGNYANFLWIQDASHISIRQLTLMGSNASNPPPPPGAPACYYDYGRAIFIQSATGPAEDISILNNVFTNFTGTSWISVLGSESGGVDGVTIADNTFKSVEGNSVAPQYIVCPASAVAVQGLGPTASATNVSVLRNFMEADFIKSGVAVWSGAARVTIAGNIISRAGMGLPLPHNYSNGSYAILVYQQHAVAPDTTVFAKPTDIDIVDNVIDSPYSSGIYVLEGRSMRIERNHISGQIDTYDITEPRGAIALNEVDNAFGGSNTEVNANIINSSAIGLSIAGGTLPIVDSNTIESIPSNGVGLKVDGIAADGVTLTLTNTVILANERAANVSSVVGFFPSLNLTIDGLYQVGVAHPMRWYSAVANAPDLPQKTYCSFRQAGSIKGVFTANADCRFPTECWIPQLAFQGGDDGENCASGAT